VSAQKSDSTTLAAKKKHLHEWEALRAVSKGNTIVSTKETLFKAFRALQRKGYLTLTALSRRGEYGARITDRGTFEWELVKDEKPPSPYEDT
jgi:hypothetical protein